MTLNELVAKIALRASELADMKLPELRKLHPHCYNTGTDYEAKQVTVGMSRGEIIDYILGEEFGVDSHLDYELQAGQD